MSIVDDFNEAVEEIIRNTGLKPSPPLYLSPLHVQTIKDRFGVDMTLEAVRRYYEKKLHWKIELL